MRISRLKKHLHQHVAVRRTGLFGLGRKIEFSEKAGTLKYTVNPGMFKNEEELAASINSRMPGAAMRPKS